MRRCFGYVTVCGFLIADLMPSEWWLRDGVCVWQKMMKEIGDRKWFAVGVERIEKNKYLNEIGDRALRLRQVYLKND